MRQNILEFLRVSAMIGLIVTIVFRLLKMFRRGPKNPSWDEIMEENEDGK